MAVEFAPGLLIRGITPPLRLADFKLVAFDMDSTLINIECVDEIAAAAGRRAEVAAITEAAMRGEIADYKDSLRQRVALLKGVPESALHAVYSQQLQINPGVEAFVQACQRAARDQQRFQAGALAGLHEGFDTGVDLKLLRIHRMQC